MTKETLQEKATRVKAKFAAAKAKAAPAAKAPAAKAPAAKKKTAAAAPEFDLEAAAEAEVAVGAKSGPADIQRAVELGNLMLKAEAEVVRLEAELSEAKERYRKIEQGDLPDLMAELGLPMFKLADGSVFELVEDVQCGISEERRPAAHRWIREHGFAGLIKTEIKATFAPDELDRADALESEMREDGLTPERKEAIHAARLKSFVKERLAAGDEIPFDLFGIHPFNKAKYKQPKGAKRS